jgi:hypothetical protein
MCTRGKKLFKTDPEIFLTGNVVDSDEMFFHTKFISVGKLYLSHNCHGCGKEKNLPDEENHQQ